MLEEYDTALIRATIGEKHFHDIIDKYGYTFEQNKPKNKSISDRCSTLIGQCCAENTKHLDSKPQVCHDCSTTTSLHPNNNFSAKHSQNLDQQENKNRQTNDDSLNMHQSLKNIRLLKERKAMRLRIGSNYLCSVNQPQLRKKILNSYKKDDTVIQNLQSFKEKLLQSRSEDDKLMDNVTSESIRKAVSTNEQDAINVKRIDLLSRPQILSNNLPSPTIVNKRPKQKVEDWEWDDENWNIHENNNETSMGSIYNITQYNMNKVIKEKAMKHVLEIQTILKEIENEGLHDEEMFHENQYFNNREDLEAHNDSHMGSVNQLTSELVHLTSELKERSKAIRDKIDEDNPMIDRQIELQDRNIEASKQESKRLRQHTRSLRWTLFQQFSSIIIGLALFFFMTMIIHFFAKH